MDVGGKRSHVEILQAGLEECGWRAPILDWASLSWMERALGAGPFHVLNRVVPGLGQRWLGPASAVFFAARISAAIRRLGRVDLIHVHEPLTYLPARRAAGDRPVVETVHGPISRELMMMTGFHEDHASVRYLRELERRAFLGADLVISVDTPHADYVRGFGRLGEIPIIPNFVDTRRFHPGVLPVTLSDDVERWIAGRPVVLCPRRMVPKNGIDVFVRAGAELRRLGVPAALLVAGTGPQLAELTGLVRAERLEDQIRFLGEVSQANIPELYRRASVVVVPSVPAHGVEEATSISALEAQACGRPLVASAIGGLPEIVEDGRNGTLVAASDPGALARAIAGLLADPDRADALGHSAAQDVEAGRSHRHGARKVIALYEQLLERNSGGQRP